MWFFFVTKDSQILLFLRKGFQENPVLEEIVTTGEITQGYSYKQQCSHELFELFEYLIVGTKYWYYSVFIFLEFSTSEQYSTIQIVSIKQSNSQNLIIAISLGDQFTCFSCKGYLLTKREPNLARKNMKILKQNHALIYYLYTIRTIQIVTSEQYYSVFSIRSFSKTEYIWYSLFDHFSKTEYIRFIWYLVYFDYS